MSETEREKIRQEILAENRAYKREYMRKWRAANRDRVRANQERYILKKADSIGAEQTNEKE